MDKSALLTNLKIDRAPEPPDSRVMRRWIVVVTVAVAVVVLAIIAWFLLVPSDRPTVDVAEARPPAAAASGAALLEASGYVVARREATVSSKITGRVMEMLIEEGQHVTAGQVMARLDASNVTAALDQARAQVRAAEANAKRADVALANARPRFERTQKLFKSGWVTEQTVEDARTAYDDALYNAAAVQRQLGVAHASLAVAERSLDDTVVRAPFAGVVTVKNAQPGEMVSPVSAGGGFTRTGIGTIVDMHSLEVEVDVAESYINRVKPGMPATVQLNAYPDWRIPAEVGAVIPTGDRSKATVKVRVRFKLEDPRIIPEMGAKVAFLNAAPAPEPRAPRSIEIPASAIISGKGNQSAVFVIDDDLTAERRTVKLGGNDGDQRIVLEGLRTGEKVAVGNLSELSDGMKVRLKTP